MPSTRLSFVFFVSRLVGAAFRIQHSEFRIQKSSPVRLSSPHVLGGDLVLKPKAAETLIINHYSLKKPLVIPADFKSKMRRGVP